MDSLTIYLDNPSMTYAPGQSVSGNVVIKTNREISTKSVHLNFKGKASVMWSEVRLINTANNTSRSYTQIYSNEEIFFNFDTYLLGNGHTEAIIPAGDSFYPFFFRLPSKNLPSDFEGVHGKVEYTLSANVQRSWKFDKKTKQRVSINPILDLNEHPKASLPASWTKSKTFGFLWWESAPLTMDVKQTRSGYCPGEILSLEVVVNNMSRKVINNLSAALIRTVEYVTSGKSKYNTTTLSTVKRGVGVWVGQTDTWMAEMEVPNVLPTNLGGCRIIRVSYAVTVTAHVSGAGFNLSYDCPIIIGTEPLRV